MISVYKNPDYRFYAHILAAVLWTAVIILGGCGGTEPGQEAVTKNDTTQQQAEAVTDDALSQALEQRANDYWSAMKSRDFFTVYQMLADAQPRGSKDPSTFYRLMSKSLPVINYKVESVELTGKTQGNVQVQFVYGLVSQGATHPIEKHRKQQWSLIDGQWYLGEPPSKT